MESDREYYSRRAEEELERAQKSHEPTAVRAHYELANHYLSIAYEGADGAAAASSKDALTKTPSHWLESQ